MYFAVSVSECNSSPTLLSTNQLFIGRHNPLTRVYNHWSASAISPWGIPETISLANEERTDQCSHSLGLFPLSHQIPFKPYLALMRRASCRKINLGVTTMEWTMIFIMMKPAEDHKLCSVKLQESHRHFPQWWPTITFWSRVGQWFTKSAFGSTSQVWLMDVYD